MATLGISLSALSNTFSKVYQNPAAYGLDESKKRQPYTQSKDFHINPDRTSPAKGYMFWDDIHPTAYVHAVTGKLMSEFIDSIYTLKPPAPTHQTDPVYMVKTFLREYHKTLRTERESIWSGYGISTAPHLPHDAIESKEDYPRILADFLYHGLNEGGTRTLKILQNLKWVDKNKNIDISNPALLQAKEIYDRKTNSPKHHI